MAEPFLGRRAPWTEPPMGLLAELTHRCPLRCAYCSNPLALTPASYIGMATELARRV